MNRILLAVILFCGLFSFNGLAQPADPQGLDTDALLTGSLTGIDPASATIPQSLTVEISGSGTHFAMGTGTSVWFSQGSSTIYSDNTVALNNVLLQAEMLFTNYHDPGYYDVNTYNQNDGLLTLPDGFFLNENPNPPLLINVSPDNGLAGEIALLTITGQNTNFSQAYNYVYLTKSGASGLSATFVTVLNDETLEAEIHVPTGSTPGFYNVYVSNQWDGNMGLISAFEILPDPDPPYLTGIDPDNGTIPESLTVTISGVNTHFNQGTGTFISLRQGSSSIIYPTGVIPLSDTEIDASFTFDNFDVPGYYDVRTYSALDGTLNLYDAFYLFPNPNPPMLVAVDPDQAMKGETLDVEITGQNTSFSQGTGTTMWLNKDNTLIFPNSVSTLSDELLDVNLSIDWNVPTGLYTVNTLNNVDGLLTLPVAFNITTVIPELVEVVPDHGYLGDTVLLQVTGENTHFLEASTSMSAWLYNGSQALTSYSLSPVSNTLAEMEFVLTGALEAGLWDVNVQNDIDGTIALVDGFELIDTISGVRGHEEPFSMQIVPNPSRGVFNFTFEASIQKEVKLIVMNHQGRKIQEFRFSGPPVIQRQIDLSTYPSGIYIAHVSYPGYSITHKIIIAR